MKFLYVPVELTSAPCSISWRTLLTSRLLTAYKNSATMRSFPIHPVDCLSIQAYQTSIQRLMKKCSRPTALLYQSSSCVSDQQSTSIRSVIHFNKISSPLHFNPSSSQISPKSLFLLDRFRSNRKNIAQEYKGDRYLIDGVYHRRGCQVGNKSVVQ